MLLDVTDYEASAQNANILALHHCIYFSLQHTETLMWGYLACLKLNLKTLLSQNGQGAWTSS